jgi:hypothetical protein
VICVFFFIIVILATILAITPSGLFLFESATSSLMRSYRAAWVDTGNASCRIVMPLEDICNLLSRFLRPSSVQLVDLVRFQCQICRHRNVAGYHNEAGEGDLEKIACRQEPVPAYLTLESNIGPHETRRRRLEKEEATGRRVCNLWRGRGPFSKKAGSP